MSDTIASDRNTAARNTYLDIVKYFTIFCVLWGHVVQQTCMLEHPNNDYIYRTIYTFHMPLFMGICGYFFAKSIARYGYMEYIRKKLKNRLLGLIVPMISFGVLKTVICQEYELYAFLKNIHGIWFLGDLAINSCLLLAIVRYCNSRFYHDIKVFLLSIPLIVIPFVGYGFNGLFLWLFFVGGYGLATYYSHDFVILKKYWKYFLVLFIIAFIIFDLMYEPLDAMIRAHDFFKLIIIFGLKLTLGITGCYLALLLMYIFIPHFKSTKLERRAIEQGRYTLDIYLLNIIILEKIGGPLYRKFVEIFDYNIFHSYGLLFELIGTFLGACLMMEIIIFISSIMNENYYIAKIFFYRNINVRS